jgi:hypothetical protein
MRSAVNEGLGILDFGLGNSVPLLTKAPVEIRSNGDWDESTGALPDFGMIDWR